MALIFQSAYAVRYQSGDFVFDCNYIWGKLTATLLRYTGSSPDVIIPETVEYEGNIYTILYIGDEFSSPFINNTYVRTVQLPNNALSVSVESFSNCPQLESVILGRKLECIEAYSFYHCPLLREVKMYNRLSEIEEYAFAECPSLSSLTLGRGVSYLGRCVFDQTPLQSLTLLNPVPAICDGPLNSQSSWYTTCQVYVHLGSKQAYDASSEWPRFSHLDERAEEGDVTADGLVDIADVNLLINDMLGREHVDLTIGDLTQDGKIDISDINQLINIMLGKY
jgi:hypothetical protein